jgi:hypothetical protein
MTHSMPVKTRGDSARFVCEVNDDNVILADMNVRSWQLKVDAEKASLHTVCHDTFRIEALRKIAEQTILTGPTRLQSLLIRKTRKLFTHPPMT